MRNTKRQQTVLFPFLIQGLDFTNLIPNKVEEIFYLYLIYYLTDDGRYEFYAELTDEEGLNEIMSDEEEDEEE